MKVAPSCVRNSLQQRLWLAEVSVHELSGNNAGGNVAASEGSTQQGSNLVHYRWILCLNHQEALGEKVKCIDTK